MASLCTGLAALGRWREDGENGKNVENGGNGGAETAAEPPPTGQQGGIEAGTGTPRRGHTTEGE